jgi:cytoskeletal protein CcmA (bactofilin family)
MLKNKFKIIAVLLVIIFALTIPVVRAENEDDDELSDYIELNDDELSDYAELDDDDSSDYVELDDDDSSDYVELDDDDSEYTTSLTDDESFKKSDIYLTGDDITIDYIIDGNLFVLANNVTINSQIGGDVFVCANTVTIGENGYVFSNLFTLSKDVIVNGVVYDLYSASENTTINGYVYRDIHVSSNTVNILGTIGRNAFINCVNLNFVSGSNVDVNTEGIINGNLQYSAKQEASIPENSVTGEITFEEESYSNNANVILDSIISLVTFIVTVVVIWLLCLWLTPKFLSKSTSLLTTKKVLPVIGLGILSPIIGMVASIILFILGITSIVGLLILITLLVLMIISSSIFIITINNIICDKFKIQKTISILGILIISSAVFWLIGLISYIGTFIKIVAVVLGLGIILSNIFLKEKNVTNENLEVVE